MKKDVGLMIRISKTQRKRLNRIAKKRDVPAAQIVRKAITAELNKLEGTDIVQDAT